jgi:hypothetical protein
MRPCLEGFGSLQKVLASKVATTPSHMLYSHSTFEMLGRTPTQDGKIPVGDGGLRGPAPNLTGSGASFPPWGDRGGAPNSSRGGGGDE